MNKRKVTIWAVLLLVVLVLLLIIATAGYMYIQSRLNMINRPIEVTDIPPEDEYFETDGYTEDEDNGLTEVDPDDVIWPVDESVIKDEDIINILLIGQDRRPGEIRGRSDSMMIVTINKKDNRIIVTSIMRDLYVQIPGYSDNRINAAYSFGGIRLLNKTIERNLLLHIDGNVEVDFSGFQMIIEKIGGIDISINAREAEYLSRIGYPGLSGGIVHMDGDLALAYSRIRSVGHADYERTERQRRVITKAHEKINGLGFNEIRGLIDEVLPLITTDLSNKEIMNLALTIFSMNIESIEANNRIPVNGSFLDARIRGMAVLVPDISKNRKALREIIYGY